MNDFEARQLAARQAAEDVTIGRMASLEKAGARFDRIARELCVIAFSDIRDYVTIAEGGEIQAIPLDDMVRKKSMAIKKVKERTKITESSSGEKIWKESQVEYELYDKLDALKYLCRLRGDEPAQLQEHRFPDGIPMIPLDEDSAERLAAMKEVLRTRR